MIKVMIVEDEPPVCQKIIRVIKALSSDFEVVATAKNGRAALDMLENEPCDLVFTDIRMPLMDGVEFMKRLRDLLPACMIVAVSGYTDFSYVSSALRVEAIDYLRKPVTRKEMSMVLDKARSIFLERQNNDIYSLLSKQINGEILRHPKTEQPEETADLRLVLLCAGAIPVCEDPSLCPSAEYWSGIPLEDHMNFAFQNDIDFLWQFPGTSIAERILIIKTGTKNFTENIDRFYNLISNSNMPITCLYQSDPLCLSEIGGAHVKLRNALTAMLQIGRSQLIPLSNSDLSASSHTVYFDLLLPNACKVLLGEMVNPDDKSLMQMFQGFSDDNWSQHDLYALFDAALSHVYTKSKMSYQTLQQLRNTLKESFSSTLNLWDLYHNLFGLCSDEEKAEENSSNDKSVAQQIAAYLDAHFSEHINNQMLAKRFSYVPSYLTILFRKEYGISPVEYLTNIRLEHAKRMMRLSPDTLIKDIANQVGFKSQHHFSRTFKKHEEIWPSMYRTENS